MLRTKPNTPLARLDRDIALTKELRGLIAPGFGTDLDRTEAMTDQIAAAEVRLRSVRAVLTSGPEVEQ